MYIAVNRIVADGGLWSLPTPIGKGREVYACTETAPGMCMNQRINSINESIGCAGAAARQDTRGSHCDSS